jgi:hypothetical protein
MKFYFLALIFFLSHNLYAEDKNSPSFNQYHSAKKAPPRQDPSLFETISQKGELKKRQLLAAQVLSKEPSIETIIETALTQAKHNSKRMYKRLDSVKKSALLPNFRVTGRMNRDRDELLDRTQIKPDRWRADTDRDFMLQLSAQWDLPKLIFHPDELRAQKAVLDMEEKQKKLIQWIISLYYERQRRIWIEIVYPNENIEKRIENNFRIKELTSIIDSLTAGLLSRTLIE